MPQTIDLQSHSIHSDGSLPPAEVVARAAQAGIKVLALTDHDAVDGVQEALEAAQKHRLRLIPAAELSALDEDREDLHILGYGIDHTDPQLLQTLEHYREDRAARADRMLQALEQNGWAVDPTAIDARRHAGKPIGRPHLAAAAFHHPANARRISEQNLNTSSDLLEAELIPGKPSYRRRTTPTVPQAIETIHKAGGIAVWAHPFWDIEADSAVLDSLDRFIEHGLDGVEAFYVTYTREQTILLAEHARQHDVVATGSADFHGPEHPRFNRFGTFETYGFTIAAPPVP